MKSRVDKPQADEKLKYYKGTEALRTKQQALQEKLEELRMASEAA